MTGRLDGKTALVTGGAGSIGRAIAKLFAAEGAWVALLDADPATLDEAVTATGDGLLGLACDIADEKQVEECVATVLTTFGGLDILVNNAAVREYHRLADASSESWQRILGVNLVGTSNCTRACLPALRHSGKGAIVNVASIFGIAGRPGMGQYDATKAAIVSMTRVLANEEARHGVRANVVCPGSVLTSFTLGRAALRGLSEADLARSGHLPSPLDRWARPEEIAYPVLWLASDEASFITGAVLPVDGGLSAASVR